MSGVHPFLRSEYRNGEALSTKGVREDSDKRICFQASDDYFQCIEDQNVPMEKVNRFKCNDEQYNFNRYCTSTFIAHRKSLFEKHIQTKRNFLTEELAYLNIRANNIARMSVSDHEFVNSLSISKI